MIEQIQLEQAVMIQLHRNGKWSRMCPVLQVFEEHVHSLLTGKPLDWISVAIAPNTIRGNRKLAEVKKELRERREAEVDNAEGGEHVVADDEEKEGHPEKPAQIGCKRGHTGIMNPENP